MSRKTVGGSGSDATPSVHSGLAVGLWQGSELLGAIVTGAMRAHKSPIESEACRHDLRVSAPEVRPEPVDCATQLEKRDNFRAGGARNDSSNQSVGRRIAELNGSRTGLACPTRVQKP
jgi:hypothetical protein